MTLTKLNIDLLYYNRIDNIVEKLLAPCFLNSKLYLRSVGFFRSSIYALISESLEEFV